MIVLPVRQTVLFPGIVLPLAIGRPSSIAAAQEAVRSERMLGVILQNDPAVEDPTPEQLHQVGTAAQILRYVTAADGTHHVVAQGMRRFRVIEILPGFPFLVARVEEIGAVEVMTPEMEARVGLVRKPGARSHPVAAERPRRKWSPRSRTWIRHPRSPISSPASSMRSPRKSRRCWRRSTSRSASTRCLALLAQRIEVLKLSKQIGEQTQQSLSSQQREHILREQLRHIQKELGEGDEKSAEIAELREQIEKAGMPKEAEDQAKKELKRLERMPEACRRIRDDPHLSGLADRAALVEARPRTVSTSPRRAASSTRTTTVFPRSSGASSNISPCASSTRGQEPDLVLRRPARRGQDVVGAKHRARDRPQIRSAEPRRRAR